jgi:hypothetical protein
MNAALYTLIACGAIVKSSAARQKVDHSNPCVEYENSDAGSRGVPTLVRSPPAVRRAPQSCPL